MSVCLDVDAGYLTVAFFFIISSLLSNTMYLVSLNYNNTSYIVCFICCRLRWDWWSWWFSSFRCDHYVCRHYGMERIDSIVVAVDGGRFRVRRDTNSRMCHRSVPLFVPVIDSIIVVAS